MQIHIQLHGKANKISLPLRFGIHLTEQHQVKAQLEDFSYDENGTKMQSEYERDKGRRHYIGTLKLLPPSHSADDIRVKLRAVIQDPHVNHFDPALVTVLGVEQTPGDNAVTKHLEGMLQRHRITIEDIRTIFFNEYTNGNIRDSNDLETVFSTKIAPNAVVEPGDRTSETIAENPEEITAIIDNAPIDSSDEGLKKPMSIYPLNIPSTKYSYVLAEAYIENVTITDDRICFEYVDNYGQLTPIKSFKMSNFPRLRKLHKTAIEYFKERDGSRAFFSICIADNYADGLLAESVTAISLQLMRRGIKADV